MAFRPCDRAASMSSRQGSLVLATAPLAVSNAPEPVVTAPALAGFADSGPVVTSLAGFAFLRPQPPGARMEMPAAFRYPAAVSRRTPVANSIRRSAQPSWPSAMTCFFFSSFKTLLTLTEGIPHVRVNVPTTFSLAGFQVTTIGRFWVTAEAGILYSSANEPRYFRKFYCPQEP